MSKNVGGLNVEFTADNKKLKQTSDESINKLNEVKNAISDTNDASVDGVKDSLKGVNQELQNIKVSSKMLSQDLDAFMNNIKSMSASQLDELYESSVNKVQELTKWIEIAKQKQMEATVSWKWDKPITQAEYALDQYNHKLELMEMIMKNIPTEPMKEVAENTEKSKRGLAAFIDNLKQKFKSGFDEAKDSANMTWTEVDNVSDSVKRAGNNCKNFGKYVSKSFKKGINSLKRFALALLGIRTGFSYLITNMRAYINSSDEMKAKTQGIGQALQQSLAPYAEIAVAALQKVVHWVILAIGYFTTFINTIFGTKIAIGGAAKNMKALTSETQAAGKAAKQALAPFDELNILQEDNDSGGGGGVSPDFSGLGLDDVDLSGLDKFADKLNEFKNIAAAVFDNIKTKIKEVWDSQPVQAFVGYANAFGGFLLQFWTTMGVNLYNNIVSTWGMIRDNVALIWTNMTELWTTFWTDMTTFTDEWGEILIDDVMRVFNTIWKDVVDPVVDAIVKVFTEFTKVLNDTWNKYGKELLDNIGIALHTTVQLFQDMWNNIIKPIIEPFLEQLRWLWETRLKAILQNFMEFVSQLTIFALKIYNKVIEPLISWLTNILAPIWNQIWSTLAGWTGTYVGIISDIANGIITTLRGIIDFIGGVFTGDWTKVWEGIVNVFKGIFEGITGICKGVINLVIDAINGFIKAINVIHFDVPDWVPGLGGKRWGFDIQPLQKLATGTVATEPQVAQIAEYTGAKTNPEIVSPRDMMYDTMVKALRENSQGNGTNNDMTLTLNVKYEDGRTIIRKINAAQDEAGRTLLEV